MSEKQQIAKLRGRPHNGQMHTTNGARGSVAVEGLTLRDIADCYVLAVFDSASHIDPVGYDMAQNWLIEPMRLYQLDLSQLDPIAIKQNLCCRIERMMGIYPNVPGLRTKSEEP